MKIKIKLENGLIKPVTNEALFKHCAGGMIAVTLEKYQQEVEHLLFLHGVTSVEMDKADVKKVYNKIHDIREEENLH